MRLPIPVCWSCPFTVLPENFQVGLDLTVPAGFIARVIDSSGRVVSNTIGGSAAVQHLQFAPAPYAATNPGLLPGAGDAADQPARHPDTPAPDQIRYGLELIPTAAADLSKTYQLKLAFHEGRRGGAFLPLTTR